MKCLAVFAALVGSAFFSGAAAAVPLEAAYLNEPILVFNPVTVKTGGLPDSILIRGVPLTFSRDMQNACRGVNTIGNDLLVFQPAAKSCLTLTAFFAVASEVHPDIAHFSALERDRQTLTMSLTSESYVLMQPKKGPKPGFLLDGTAAPGSCSCPQPLIIFVDGFEDLL